MDPRSTHYLVELTGIPAATLDSQEAMEGPLEKLVQDLGVNIVQRNWHHFDPQGLTGFFVLASSHLQLSSYPEKEYAALDIATCGELRDFEPALMSLAKTLGATFISFLPVKRGVEFPFFSGDKYVRDFYTLDVGFAGGGPVA